MIEAGQIPQVGQFAIVTSGRDTGQYGIIIKLLDGRYVLLADGNKRKFDHPKKKNMQHLQFIDRVSPEVQTSIMETGRVTNGKLRFALAKFLNERQSDQEKGDNV
ncbi:KOW domain-containing RNA-binding protein [Neobacillus sp. SM06]|uniref:KOW domain-containing RNA-binding protein n=1 Tax=Neobacillus sp. SM06 TaxID=3422492 RepID=UPI003D284DC5